jgi:ZIP family zinc transporter
MHALLPSLLAGLATALGSIVVLIWKSQSRRTLAVLLGGAAGVMLAVVLLDLIPASLDQGTPLEAGIGFGAGVVVLWGLDKLMTRWLSDRRSSGNMQSREASYQRMGYLMATGIALHDLPEGIAIAGAYAAGGVLGPLLALSIALHNIPEGIATATPLYMGGVRARRVVLVNAIVSVFTPLGTLLGLFLLRLSPEHLSFMLALAGGAMTYLLKDELIPAAQQQSPFWSWIGLAGGYVLLWIAQIIR